MRPKSWLRAAAASLLVAGPLLLWTGPADAAVGLTPLANFTSPTVPGQVAPAQFTITNNSDGAEAVGAVTVTDITLIPSCGSSVPFCPVPDTNVFQLNSPFLGTGAAGAVCPTSYTASVINPATGEVRFTPVGPDPVLDVGEFCRINFTTTTLRVPTTDVSPAPGRQTAVLGSATGVAANGAIGSGFGTSFATVNQAPAAVTTQASPQRVDVGEGFADLATVTGAPAGPTPTGTVTFQLFGPTSPGFPTCAGAPFATSAAIPLTASAPNAAIAASGTFGLAPPAPPGNYVFVATYSGDMNYLGSSTACGDPLEQVTVEPFPTITVDKTATPLSRPEPGGTFTFNVVVTNTSPETVRITSLTDDIYGNIATQGTCTSAIGSVLAANGGTYSCSFPGSFTGLAPASQTDVVTAVAADSDGNTATDTDDATVTLTPTLPTIVVDKTAVPLSLPEPGGAFTFNVVVTNTSLRAVTITTLTDNIYGNIATQGSCTTAVGTILAANGGTYTCSFSGNFFGEGGASQTDIVTAVAVDTFGNPATDSDDAVVTITNVLPTIVVDKTATPLSRPEPGGPFTFNVVVTNTSIEPVTITSLTDDIYGNIAIQGTCNTALGTSLAANGGTYTCSFTGNFFGNAGASQTDIVTAIAVDNEGSSATDSDDAVVTLTNVLPTVLVDKTATPANLPEPGGLFTFNVVVTNTSIEPVTITTLTDDIYGNLATQGTCTTAIGTVLAPSGGSYSCSFTGSFTGNAGASQTDVVTSTVVDDDGSTATDNDDAVVTLTNVLPTIQVDKTATPVTRLEPGGAFTFNVVVTNTSVEPVTITTLTDDVYGNIATQGTCTTAIGTVLPANGGSYSCAFSGNFFGQAGAQQIDIVTATAVDDDGSTATDSDDATVAITNVVPTILVDKTATPGSLPEPGGTFTFNVVVTNTSIEAVTITALTDDIYGNIATQGTCTTAVGSVLAANGGSYSCSFPGSFAGDAGDSQTDVVTATAVDDDGSSVTDTDDAVVTITDVPPTILVDKTATPLTRPEPGGTFTFNVVVTNTSNEPVTITTLTDDVYGNIATQGTCTTAIGTVLAPGASYACSFPGSFTGDAGDSQTDVVTAVGVDNEGTAVTDTDDAVVSLTDVPPTVSVDKTAVPLSLPEPGGTFTFNVVVTNTSAESVAITTLTDDIYGNIATQGTCTTAIGTVLAPGASYSCSFPGSFTGNAGATQTDTVTSTVVDDDGTTATDTDDATVTITNVPPTVVVDKTANPLSLPEPGGTFTFNVVVTNTSAEAVTITTLTDDVYGNIATQGTCTSAVGTVLAASGGTYACSFTGSFTGTALASQTDTVTVVVTDDDASTATDTDDAVVTLTDVLPTVVVDKTATPASLPEPGGSFTFNVTVTNTSIEPVTITSLTDDIYGNIATQGTCTSAIGSVLAANGGTYSCSFTGTFNGIPGAQQTDVVTSTVVDDDGSTATDSDDATVSITDVLPAVLVDKTATPESRPEPGGTFTFNVVVTNPSTEALTITTLTDDVYGDLNGKGTCAIGAVLQPNGTYSCSFTADFIGNAGDAETDTVTVTGTDDEGTTVTDTDDAIVTITDVPPTVELVKTASPATMAAPGGQFTFSVVVTNTSAETVTITSLTDDIYGNLALLGTCTGAIGTTLAPQATYSCTFQGTFTGAGGSQTDIVTVVVTDDDDSTATDSDDATVTITGVPAAVVQQNIQSPTTPTTTSLPKTGAGVGGLLTTAVGLITFGGLLLLAASRWAPPGGLASVTGELTRLRDLRRRRTT